MTSEEGVLLENSWLEVLAQAKNEVILGVKGSLMAGNNLSVCVGAKEEALLGGELNIAIAGQFDCVASGVFEVGTQKTSSKLAHTALTVMEKKIEALQKQIFIQREGAAGKESRIAASEKTLEAVNESLSSIRSSARCAESTVSNDRTNNIGSSLHTISCCITNIGFMEKNSASALAASNTAANTAEFRTTLAQSQNRFIGTTTIL